MTNKKYISVNSANIYSENIITDNLTCDQKETVIQSGLFTNSVTTSLKAGIIELVPTTILPYNYFTFTVFNENLTSNSIILLNLHEVSADSGLPIVLMSEPCIKTELNQFEVWIANPVNLTYTNCSIKVNYWII